MSTASSMHGPSPQARGSRTPRACSKRISGSIPAGAGEPACSSPGPSYSPVHPRRRGGAYDMVRDLWTQYGPSPQARGSLACGSRSAPCARSIPAGAGEPRTTRETPSSRPVHPRRRGGALSPTHCPVPGCRSIPAGAGEPEPGAAGDDATPVHPRRRGGASVLVEVDKNPKGPSPQARGSHVEAAAVMLNHGSIPAGAGEPKSGNLSPAILRVHPRRRGGASRARWLDAAIGGPSPQARGSLFAVGTLVPCSRSIPAGAGEPIAWTRA